MTLSEAVNKVIDLSRRIRAYYAAELPKRYPNYPVVGPDEESVPPPPEEKELKDFLEPLSEELLFQLMLVRALGRGDCSTDDLAGDYAALTGAGGDKSEAVAHLMMYKATLADELADGLEELRTHKINVDRLPLKRARVRKP
jgi:hypothetical protein